MGVNQHGFDDLLVLAFEIILSFFQGLWKLSTRNCFLFGVCFAALFTCTAYCPHSAFTFAGLCTLRILRRLLMRAG